MSIVGKGHFHREIELDSSDSKVYYHLNSELDAILKRVELILLEILSNHVLMYKEQLFGSKSSITLSNCDLYIAVSLKIS